MGYGSRKYRIGKKTGVVGGALSSSSSSSSSSSLWMGGAEWTAGGYSYSSSSESSSSGPRRVRSGTRRRGRRASRTPRKKASAAYTMAMRRRNHSSYSASSSSSSSSRTPFGAFGSSSSDNNPDISWSKIARMKRKPGKKIVIFVRHAEAVYNVLPSEEEDPFEWDAGLTEHGKGQARANAELARELKGNGVAPGVIVVSPLTRTLQTMSLVFGSLIKRGTPVAVEPLAREKLSGGSDVGSSKSTLARRFKGLSFSHLPTVWWYTKGKTSSIKQARRAFKKNPEANREPDSVFKARVAKWKRYLASRKENVVAVVSHGDITWDIIGSYIANTEFVTCLVDEKSAKFRVLRRDTYAPKSTQE